MLSGSLRISSEGGRDHFGSAVTALNRKISARETWRPDLGVVAVRRSCRVALATRNHDACVELLQQAEPELRDAFGPILTRLRKGEHDTHEVSKVGDPPSDM
jgi:hypothetical protein